MLILPVLPRTWFRLMQVKAGLTHVPQERGAFCQDTPLPQLVGPKSCLGHPVTEILLVVRKRNEKSCLQLKFLLLIENFNS
jgi:hypothetical protein